MDEDLKDAIRTAASRATPDEATAAMGSIADSLLTLDDIRGALHQIDLALLRSALGDRLIESPYVPPGSAYVVAIHAEPVDRSGWESMSREEQARSALAQGATLIVRAEP